jgi:general stress protein 26
VNDQPSDAQKLAQLLDDKPIAMMTTFGAEGPRSIPMARQEVEAGEELWFITARDTEHTRAIQQEPQVSLTFSARDSWVALTGRAHVVDDDAKLEELWNSFAEAWLPEGPRSERSVLIRVDVEKAEYWDSPGSKLASLLSFAKVKLTGDTYDADHGTVEP